MILLSPFLNDDGRYLRVFVVPTSTLREAKGMRSPLQALINSDHTASADTTTSVDARQPAHT